MLGGTYLGVLVCNESIVVVIVLVCIIVCRSPDIVHLRRGSFRFLCFCVLGALCVCASCFLLFNKFVSMSVFQISKNMRDPGTLPVSPLLPYSRTLVPV